MAWIGISVFGSKKCMPYLIENLLERDYLED